MREGIIFYLAVVGFGYGVVERPEGGAGVAAQEPTCENAGAFA